jgi:hypothetical protein
MENSFAFVILGNGRKGYLERTIASWETNMAQKPKHQAIIDDSGNQDYRSWLQNTYGDRYDIVYPADHAVGQSQAVQKIFDYVKELDVTHVAYTEEDWVLFRTTNLEPIFNILNKNDNLLQMRLPRTIWYSDYHIFDLNAGSLLLDYIKDKNSPFEFVKDIDGNWFNLKINYYAWSHNPCVFKKEYVYEPYSQVGDHEYNFGIDLMNKNPNATVGFWADNPFDGYVTHIGIRNGIVLNSLHPYEKLSY